MCAWSTFIANIHPFGLKFLLICVLVQFFFLYWFGNYTFSIFSSMIPLNVHCVQLIV